VRFREQSSNPSEHNEKKSVARTLLDWNCTYTTEEQHMAEGRQLTDQEIRMVQDWQKLPKSERDTVAREIAAAARYWRQPVERRRRFQRSMNTGTSQWRSESRASG